MREALPFLRRYGVSLAATAAAVLLTLVLWPVSQRFPFALFIAAVMVSVWQGGPRSALLTTALATLALVLLYFFLPDPSASDLRQEYLPRLGMFLLVGVLATYLSRECQRAVRALDRIQATLASVGEALVLTDEQGRVTFLSPLAQSLTAWNLDEAEAKPLGQVVRLVAEGTRQPLADPVAASLRAGTTVDLADHAVLVAATGVEIPIEGKVVPLRGAENRLVGVGLAFRDATLRCKRESEWQQRLQTQAKKGEQAEQALHESERRWAAFLDQLPGIAFLKDAQGRYVHVNAAYEQVLQLDPGTWRNLTDAELLLHPQVTSFAELDQQVLQTKQACQRVVVVRVQDHEQHYLLRQFAVLNELGALQLLGGIGLDISPQQQAEAALHRAQEDFARQLEERTAAQEQMEGALRQARVELEQEIQAKTLVQQQTEQAVRQTREDFEKQLQERTAKQKKAEEALRQARAEFERDLQERLAEHKKAEDAWRQALEADQGQVVQQAAALERAEAALRNQLREQTAEHSRREEALRKSMEDATRQLHERTAEQKQVEEALWRDCQDLERQLQERTVAQKQAEDALEKILQEGQRQVEELAAVHSKHLASLQDHLAQSKRTEEALRQAADQLRQDKEYLERIIESSGVGLFAFDRECRYTVWNAAMERISGIDKTKALGKSAWEVSVLWKGTGDDRSYHEALQGKTVHLRSPPYATAEAGQQGWLESCFAPLHGQSAAILGGVAMIHEQTERVQAEERPAPPRDEPTDAEPVETFPQAEGSPGAAGPVETPADEIQANGSRVSAPIATGQLAGQDSADWLSFN